MYKKILCFSTLFVTASALYSMEKSRDLRFIVQGQIYITDERNQPTAQPAPFNSMFNDDASHFRPKPFEGTLKLADTTVQKIAPLTIPLSETMADFAQKTQSLALQSCQSVTNGIVLYDQETKNYYSRGQELLKRLSTGYAQTVAPAALESLTNNFEQLVQEVKQYSDAWLGRFLFLQMLQQRVNQLNY